jgi:hypothetical protein
MQVKFYVIQNFPKCLYDTQNYASCIRLKLAGVGWLTCLAYGLWQSMNFCRPGQVLRLFPARCKTRSHIMSSHCLAKIYVKSNLHKSGSSSTVLFVHLCQFHDDDYDDDDDDDNDDVPCSPALCMLSVPIYQPGRTSSYLCTPSIITSL